MLILTLRRVRSTMLSILVACLILLGLCWGVPRCYDYLASEDDEFKELDDPVRVEAFPDAETTGNWLRVFGR